MAGTEQELRYGENPRILRLAVLITLPAILTTFERVRRCPVSGDAASVRPVVDASGVTTEGSGGRFRPEPLRGHLFENRCSCTLHRIWGGPNQERP